jgi:uncharacterized CHY-type Zn-finger protein
MYGNCYSCGTRFTSNEAITGFRIGCILAYNATAARLWVICERCETWTLAEPYETVMAIAECEHRFRSSTRRIAALEVALNPDPERTREPTS